VPLLLQHADHREWDLVDTNDLASRILFAEETFDDAMPEERDLGRSPHVPEITCTDPRRRGAAAAMPAASCAIASASASVSTVLAGLTLLGWKEGGKSTFPSLCFSPYFCMIEGFCEWIC